MELFASYLSPAANVHLLWEEIPSKLSKSVSHPLIIPSARGLDPQGVVLEALVAVARTRLAAALEAVTIIAEAIVDLDRP